MYYHLMRLSGGVQIRDGQLFINLTQLRDFSQQIACVGLILAFYLGLTRIQKPVFHLLYGAIIVSIPMFSYTCAGVNNDTLAFLGTTIVLIALMRFCEEKRNVYTYLLLSIGIFTAIMAKLTSGLIVSIACLIFLMGWIIRNRSLSILLTPCFVITLPVYFVIVVYFLDLLSTYGTVQPSLGVLDPEAFYSSGFYVPVDERSYMTLEQYISYYWSHFGETWTGIASHVSLLRSGKIYGINRIGLFLVLVLPVLSFWGQKNTTQYAAQCIYIGTLFAMVYQFYKACTAYYHVSGYMGAYQSRYYLCALPAMAYLICILLDERIEYVNTYMGRYGKRAGIISSLCVIMYCALLIYEDFIYFILNFNKYL